jgi:hypothetical protein
MAHQKINVVLQGPRERGVVVFVVDLNPSKGKTKYKG